MARQRSKISKDIKEQLRQEAGNKCANPGCPNIRTHLHHIQEWAVYETHDAQYMIAVCPTCHDAIHHGSLPISDEKVYEWKRISRSQSTIDTHLYVEPGATTKILLGSIAVLAEEVIVFKLTENNRLRFRAEDGDILLLDLRIYSTSKDEILRVVNNYVRHNRNRDISFKAVPGHVQVTAPTLSKYIPAWVVRKMQLHESSFAESGEVTLLSLEAIRPGVVRVQGVWVESGRAIIATQERLSFITPSMNEPLDIVGAGENSALLWTGTITSAMFGFK